MHKNHQPRTEDLLKPVQKEVVTGWLKGNLPLQDFTVLTCYEEEDDNALIVTDSGSASLVSSFKRHRVSDEVGATENTPTSKKRKRALSELIPSPCVLATGTEEELMLLTKDVPVYTIDLSSTTHFISAKTYRPSQNS